MTINNIVKAIAAAIAAIAFIVLLVVSQPESGLEKYELPEGERAYAADCWVIEPNKFVFADSGDVFVQDCPEHNFTAIMSDGGTENDMSDDYLAYVEPYGSATKYW